MGALPSFSRDLRLRQYLAQQSWGLRARVIGTIRDGPARSPIDATSASRLSRALARFIARPEPRRSAFAPAPHGPFVGEAIAGNHGIARKPATARAVVARLVRQCEGQSIFTDEWMEGEATINPDKALATLTKCLRVHYSGLRIDFIFDAGERRPKFGDKDFQNFSTGRRAAEGNIIWQGERVQHVSAVSHLERSLSRQCTKLRGLSTSR
jgi:hypothetical protein